MSEIDPPVSETDVTDPTPYLSLASMRAAHRDLMQKRRDEGETAAFYQIAQTFLQRGIAAGAYLAEEQARWEAQNLLDYWENDLFHAGWEPPDSLLAEFDPSLQPEIPDEKCPYVGLQAFGEKEGQIFFGRSKVVLNLVDLVRASRLVGIIGPSGSGKSSLVRAGLLPRLQEGNVMPGSESWRIYPVLVPGSTPLANLVRALRPEADEAWAAAQVAAFQQNPAHLASLVDEDGGETAVLIIDQFEETFTLCLDGEARRAFVDNLLHLIQVAEAGHRVILTMRTDYESHLAAFPLLQNLLADNTLRVTTMNAAELREAIEKPAELVGLKFQEGLIDELVREILGEPAALPLLQFTLLQLWDNRERNRVTWESYRRLGGVQEALGRTADQIYQSLIPEEQVTAKRIMLRLVQPSEGLEVTRNRVRRRDLYKTGEAPDRVDRVLKRLIEARLVQLTEGARPEDDQVEVAHEALVRNWPRLVEWLDEARIRLRQRLQLTNLAQKWDRLNRDADILLRGRSLREAQGYDDLTQLETEFVRASQDAMEKAEREKETARQRELETARRIAEEQRQRAEAQAVATRRLRQFNIVLVLLLLIAVAGILLWSNNRRLQDEATAAEAQREALAIESTNEALAAQTTIQAQSLAEATALAAQALATQQVATSQAQAAARATTDAELEAAAAAATATTQYTAARATQQAMNAQATNTPLASTAQPDITPTPDPAELLSQFIVEAQLNAVVRPKDNMPMLYITGYPFQMGAADADPEAAEDETPAFTVTLPDFYIDQYEVSVRQYASFLNQNGGYRDQCNGFLCVATGLETQYTYLLNNLGFFEPKAGAEPFPANWVSWHGARAYCEWVNARLPTEAEWEYAAGGIDGRLYPWGDEAPTQERAVFGYPDNAIGFSEAFRPTNHPSQSVSPFGVFGMAGSVWEWVQDAYDPEYYAADPGTAVNDAAESNLRVLRGGAWNSEASELRVNNRDAADPTILLSEVGASLRYRGVGFRCARDGDFERP